MKTTKIIFGLLLIPAFIFAQNLPTPEAHFGHRMGAEGQIISFFDGIKY